MEESEYLYKCNISNLQSQSSKRFSLKRPKWESSKLPTPSLTSSTFVCLNNNIISIGGKDANGTPTAVMQSYSQTTNTWKIIGHLSTPRSACFAAILPNCNQLMVVGGRIEKGETNSVEITNIR